MSLAGRGGQSLSYFVRATCWVDSARTCVWRLLPAFGCRGLAGSRTLRLRGLGAARGRGSMRRSFVALEYRRDIFHRSRAPFLAMFGKIQFILAGSHVRLGDQHNVVLVFQQIRQVGRKRLLQIEKLICRLAVLSAEAGIFVLRNAARHAVHAGQNRSHRHVSLKSQIQTVGASIKLAAPIFLRRDRFTQ